MVTQIALANNDTLTIQHPRTRIRDIFGIIPITIYTKNFGCKVSCVYCPQVAEIPKSYLINEDTERAKSVDYEADLQLIYWIEELNKRYQNSKPIKLEIIILGGTFGDLTQEYRSSFFKKMYDKLNGFISKDLQEAKNRNRNARFRACIINIETRPDTITETECSFLRELGVSKIELGIQSIYDNVLKFSGRPYSQKNIIEATNMVKSNGFKLGYHIMLNLPLSDLDQDENMLFEVSNNPNFQPDFLKVYPLTLIKEREYQKRMWRLFDSGVWKPYNKEQLLFLLMSFKKQIPEFIRIQRIQRQFDDSDYLYEDFKFRNLLDEMLKEKNQKCNCIRCKELETYKSKFKVTKNEDFYLQSIHISKQEYYLALKSVNGDYLLGYLRLHLGEIAIVREIKVIGKSSKVGKKGHLQGNGLGKYLIDNAEILAKGSNYQKLNINASFGVHNFFVQLGYNFNNIFLEKEINGITK